MSKGALPSGWVMTRFRDVVVPVSKTDPRKWSPGETLIYYDIGGIDNARHRVESHQVVESATAPSRARQEVAAGDVLFSTVRPYLENIASVPENANTAKRTLASTGFCVLRPIGGVDHRFLFYRCLAPDLLGAMKQLQQGTSYPAIRDDDLMGFPFALPPAREQRRISDEIDRRLSHLAVAEASLRWALDRVARAEGALAEEAVAGRLVHSTCDLATAQTEADNLVAAAAAKNSKAKWRRAVAAQVGGPESPWPVATLGRIAQDADYGTSEKCSTDASGVAVLRIPNVRRRALDLSDLKYLPQSKVEDEKRLSEGDVLFIRSNGSAALIGVACAVTGPATGLLFASYLIRFRLGSDATLAKWVQLVALAPSRRRWLVAQASNSAGQNNLGQPDIGAMPIPIPARDDMERTLAEYERRQSLLESTRRTIERQLARCTQIRSSVLSAAFTGNLVPQDPEDTPAAQLLTDIKAQQTTAAMKPARKRSPRAKKEKTT